MRKFKLPLLYLITCSFEALCQTGQLAGRIVDVQTQESLPYAHVFVNNTTLGTTTDEEGKFILKNVPTGSIEIVYSFIGYQTYQARVTVVEGETAALTIQLSPAKEELKSVEVKSSRDKEWLKQLKRFEKVFFGEKFGAFCNVLNPWVLDFQTTNDSKSLVASASAPLEIINNHLGYSILFHLKNFQANSQSYLIDGNSYFVEMTDPIKKETWTENRETAYLGSDRHLFKSILNNTVAEEGFRLYADKPGAVDRNNRSDIFYAEVGKKVIEYGTKNIASPSGSPYEYIIQLNGRTEIHYLKKSGSIRYYKDVQGAVSWIEILGNRLRVNNNGVVTNSTGVVYSGEISYSRIGTLLPLDYNPSKTISASKSMEVRSSPFLEKVYIHTDKPYYYPGETIWMKGYMKYSHSDSGDSLSSVLHVEMINEAKEIVQSKMLKIDSGWTAADFILPTSLPKGNYLLRAYTNWMKNFGESCFFFRPVPILHVNEKMEQSPNYVAATDSSVIVLPNKEVFKPREKITIAIWVTDENRLPVGANLSISVTDEKQVARIKEQETILNGLSIPDLPNPTRFFYSVEHGITLSGSFKNDRQKPEQVSLLAVVGKLEDLIMIDTDATGNFELNGLQFYDSIDLAFQAKDRRGKPYGNVTLTQRDVPPILSWKRYKRLTISDAGSAQRLLSEYEISKNATMLNDITVVGTRIEEHATEIQHKIFGKPDHTVKGEALLNSGATNLAVALQGKVPGLVIGSEMDGRGVHYTIRIRGYSSILLSMEPLVLIDGVPVGGSAFVHPMQSGGIGGSMGDTAGDRMAMLDINMIDRVEVTTRTNSLYGDAGRNGVIAVFTKASSLSKPTNINNLKTVEVFKITGYSKPRKFKLPDYSNLSQERDNTDYRSTLYWNPYLKPNNVSGECYVSFFAADLPGRYKVIVEGVSETGRPLRSESFIVVDSN